MKQNSYMFSLQCMEVPIESNCKILKAKSLKNQNHLFESIESNFQCTNHISVCREFFMIPGFKLVPIIIDYKFLQFYNFAIKPRGLLFFITKSR